MNEKDLKDQLTAAQAEIADNHLEREAFEDEIARLNRTIAGMNEAHGVLVSEHADAKAEIGRLRGKLTAIGQLQLDPTWPEKFQDQLAEILEPAPDHPKEDSK